MRIDEVLSSQVVQESKQSNASQSAKGDDAFALLLQNEIAKPQEQTVEDDAVCQSESLSAPRGSQPLVPTSAQSPEVSQSVSALDGVLTQLDSLQNALREAKSPKDVDALIEQINTQTAGLDAKMSGLPADHPLRDMAEDLKVTAYMESVKWKRGDYL
jgi:hypothetical protein